MPWDSVVDKVLAIERLPTKYIFCQIVSTFAK